MILISTLAATTGAGAEPPHSAGDSARIVDFMAANVSGPADSHGETSDWVTVRNTGSTTVELGGMALTDDPRRPTRWRFPPVQLAAGDSVTVRASGRNTLEAGLHTDFRLSRRGGYLALNDREGEPVHAIHYGAQSPDIPWSSGSGEVNEATILSPTSRITKLPLQPTVDAPAGLMIGTQGQPPAGPAVQSLDVVTTNTVIRYQAADAAPGIHGEEVRSWLDQEGSPLPAASIIVDPKLLHDPQSGIVTNYLERGRAWEREAWIEVLRPGAEAFTRRVGLRIHGNSTRHFAKKSFRAYGRPELDGPRLENEFLPYRSRQEFNSIALRGLGGNEWPWSMMRDAVAGTVGRRMGLIAPDAEPVSVFLNGDYYGGFQFRERVDSELLRHRFGWTECDIVFIAFGYEPKSEEGDLVFWEAMNRLLREADPNSPDFLARMREYLDLSDYTDYVILRAHLQEQDWPHNNMHFVRSRKPGTPFRMVLHDSDFSLALYPKEAWNLDPFDWVLRDAPRTDISPYDPPHHVESTLLLRTLMQNDAFRRAFLARWLDLLNGELSGDALASTAEDVWASLGGEPYRDHARWDGMAEFDEQRAIIREFALRRPDVIREAIARRWGLGESVQTTIEGELPAGRAIRIGTLVIRELPWSGVHLSGLLPEPELLGVAPVIQKLTNVGDDSRRLYRVAGELGN